MTSGPSASASSMPFGPFRAVSILAPGKASASTAFKAVRLSWWSSTAKIVRLLVAKEFLLDGFLQQFLVNRLGNVAIETVGQNLLPAAFHRACRHRDHRDMLQGIFVSDRIERLETIHHGKGNIHQDEIRRAHPGQLDAQLAVGSFDDGAGVLQHRSEEHTSELQSL